jgi:Glycosyl hydrolases family 2, TIM barrel domain/Glycosyl hydrolases family 2, sugar binding domain/Glycosyl hydrolases family 2
MQRRQFLELAGRVGTGLGIAGPLLGPEAIAAFPLADQQKSGAHNSNKDGQTAPTLASLLDGDWLIATDPGNAGRDQKWFLTPRPDAKTTPVPSIIQEAFPAYHGVVWYWRKFDAPVHPYNTGRYLLRFNAVDYLADVWLNGLHLCTHEGGETPFVFDATGAIRPGQSNSLALRVLNPGDEPIDGIVLPETPHRNKFTGLRNGALADYGGIIEPVELLLTPAVRITDVFLRPDWRTGRVPISVTVQNALSKPSRGRVHFVVTTTSAPQIVLTDSINVDLAAGESGVTQEIAIADHHLWDITDPYLYRLQVIIAASDVDGVHGTSTGFGFRDFRVVNGYFRLNGRRIFVRSTHTGNHCPYRVISPPDGYPDMLRKDLIYAKASGFNMVRFISGTAHPWELDMCDELGLMIYEEASCSWLLKDSPQMKTRYQNSMREMILRDRNHPCLVMWGMLNETEDGPVHRAGESSLPFVRSFDDSRLIILSSGRFDGHLGLGSVSNPNGTEWELAWGKEALGGAQVKMDLPSAIGTGDFHLYPKVPQTPEVNTLARNLGSDSKPVFLSEYGIGSMMNVIHELRKYEQAGIPAEAEDFILMRSMADHFVADWSRFGMDVVYPFPETLLRESQAAMARHRLLGFNLIRSNPKLCGFNLTGMLDHAFTGEGVWRFWRDWKPGAFDAMQDGWAPVRWCLFVEPTNVYAGRSFTVEAVLANEDATRPGEYPAQFRVWGPNGLAWEHQSVVRIPSATTGQDGPLAVPVMKEEIVLHGPEGAYELVPYIERGISPPEASWQFHVTDPALFPRLDTTLVTWGVPANVQSWLTSHGATMLPFRSRASVNRELILVGDVSATPASASDWRALAESMATGSTVVFLSQDAFKRDKQEVAWLPLANKGRIHNFNDWLYHKECVAKPHPIFEGLQGKGMLDWYYYGPIWPHHVFEGQDTPAEVVAASFAAGYSTAGGYASGVLLGSYKFGAGQFIVNSFPIIEYVDKHPAADRLLLNLIKHASTSATGSAVALPADFQARLKQIGYAD